MTLPGEDGRRNVWHESLMRCIQLAEVNWVKIVANMMAGSYDAHQAQGDLSNPEWSEHSMKQLVEIAFKGRIISSESDDIIQELLGRI